MRNVEHLTKIYVLKVTLGVTSESCFYTLHVRSLKYKRPKTTYEVFTAQVTSTLLYVFPHVFISETTKKIQLKVALTLEKYHSEELDIDDRLILKFIAIYM